MISIRRYLDGTNTPSEASRALPVRGICGNVDLSSSLLRAYCAALSQMGRSSRDAFSASGKPLQEALESVADRVAASPEAVAASERAVQSHLENWGRNTARHLQKQAAEVKEILLTMARAAGSVGERDRRCAKQIDEVTHKLRQVASLDDLVQIRSSIEASASELKNSIDRMAAEGRAMLSELQSQVSAYQTRLEEAEALATYDTLTRLRNRMWVEDQIEKRVERQAPFCIAMIDVDDFKDVNDEFGHLAGDELLRQFASELKSALRSVDIVGRWGGDEFIVVLDCSSSEAASQINRVSKWICGSYNLQKQAKTVRINVRASIGLEQWVPGEDATNLLARADTAMYKNKAEGRAARYDAGL